MIAFNDSINRWHGVDPVFGGERFSLCIWYTDPDRFEDVEEDPRDEWNEDEQPKSEKKFNYAILPE
jgi:hypothetical protein